jgi:hypothetical protein
MSQVPARRLVRSAFLSAVATLVGLALSTAPARADLFFPESTVHLGRLRCGAPLRHHFDLVNKGPGVVEITAVKPSCGCAVARLAEHVYQPGTKGTLGIELRTLSQTAGPHSWSVRVEYKAGDEVREQTLWLKGELVSEVSVQPTALNLFTEKSATQEITVTDLRPDPFHVTAVRCTDERLAVRLGDPRRDQRGRTVTTVRLDVPGDYPAGQHDEVVSVYTSDPAYPSLEIPVTVVKASRRQVTATPESLQFAARRGEPVPSQLIVVRGHSPDGVVVDSVTADHPAVVCRWVNGASGIATVRVSLDRARLPGDQLQSSVQIHVSKPAAETITVPLGWQAQ